MAFYWPGSFPGGVSLGGRELQARVPGRTQGEGGAGAGGLPGTPRSRLEGALCDLVALSRKKVRLIIQVKRCKNGDGIRPGDLRALRVLPVPPSAMKEPGVWRDGKGFVRREKL